MSDKNPTAPKVVRTSAGLRDALFDELDALRDGSSNPARANSVAKIASGMVDTVRMEMEVQKHLRAHPAVTGGLAEGSALGAPLSLGQNV